MYWPNPIEEYEVCCDLPQIFLTNPRHRPPKFERQTKPITITQSCRINRGTSIGIARLPSRHHMDVRLVGIKHLQIILEVEKKASYIVSEADENVACPLHNPADESKTFVFPSHLLWRLSPYTTNDFIQWISQRQLWYMESGEIKKKK